MDTLLINGDHHLDGRGVPAVVEGDAELIQRALIRLGVRRGSFPLAPALGSELHKLRGAHPDSLGRLALGYAQEALAPIGGLTVEHVEVGRENRDELVVAVTVAHRQQFYQLEVTVT